MPHELLNVLRLRILGKRKILGKSQIWVETFVQSPFQKLNFGNSSQKKKKKKDAKVDIKLFLPCPVLLNFSILLQIFSQDCLSRQSYVLTRPGFLQTFFFTFCIYQSNYSTFKENIKQANNATFPNLMVFCKQYFTYLVYVKN